MNMRHVATISLLVIGLFLPVSILQADDNERDSLLAIWNDQSLPDTSRMQGMFLLINTYYLNQIPDSAIFYSQQLNDMAQSSGSLFFRAHANSLLGNSLASYGSIEKGLPYLQKALEIWTELKHLPGIADMYRSLGNVELRIGSLDSAMVLLNRGLQIHYQSGDSSRAHLFLISIAAIFQARGDIPTAIEHQKNALELCRKFSGAYETLILHNLALNYENLGDFSRSTEYYLLALETYKEADNSYGAANVLNDLANLCIGFSGFPKAKEYLDEASNILSQNDFPQIEARYYQMLGAWHANQEQYPAALEAYLKSLQIIKEKGITYLQFEVEGGIGFVNWKMGKLSEGEKYILKAVNRSKESGNIYEQLSGSLLMVQLLSDQGKWKQAKIMAEEGFDLAQKNGSVNEMSNFAKELSHIYQSIGDPTASLRMYQTHIELRDSLFNEENTRKVINQEYKYQAYKDSLQNATSMELQSLRLQRRTQTNWLLGGMLALVAMFSIILLNRFRLTRKQKQIIEDEKEKLNQANTRLQEMDNFKSRFFTNISHEFRTPLTVIGGMIDQIEEKPEKWLGKGSSIVRRNVQGLLSLINQILDLRKLESGQLTLSPIQTDVVRFLRLGVASFESMAESKEIQLNFQSSEEEILMDFDPEKLGQIQNNLISNAIKFTPKGGSIMVKLSRWSEKSLQLIVTDTGAGIPAAKLPLIFDRFYQVDGTDTREGEGTGIGLSLVKELTHLMKGEISVDSSLGKGSRFVFTMPIQQEAPIQAGLTYHYHVNPPLIDPIPESSAALSNPTLVERPSVLIIEDNSDIIEYLYACLEEEYELFSANDGQAGIEAALEQVPDLIISDVMMPKKNGYEVCEILKLDERTSHIPIVMLTAKADQESRLEGYKRGADAYLAKPFDQRELSIRLTKLWEIRQRLQARYQQSPASEQSEDPAIQLEDAFINKVRSLIIEHIDDARYRGDALCEDAGISRTNLHRKIKALTGKTTSAFIRSVRLDFSKDLLLQQEDLQVAEVAYSSGFNDPAYFNRVFQEAFGIPPGEWRVSHSN